MNARTVCSSLLKWKRLTGALCPLVMLCIGAGLITLLMGPVSVGAQETEGPASRYVTIDFNDVDINLFIKYISELTGKNFIVDRTVKGKVTILSPTRISEEDAYHVFESVLEVHGFTTVPSGSVIKIIPSVQARSKSIETIRDQEALLYEDKVVTQLIPLTHTDPEDVKRLLAPLVSKTSVVIAHTDSGMLIITDFLSNITRLREIIVAVDVPSVGEELVVIPLKYASAENVAKAVSQLFMRTATPQQRQRVQSIQVLPYEQTNSLIVFASRTDIQKVHDLLAQIDSEAPKGTGKIQVYYLQHANAEEMVKVLTSLPDDQTGAGDAAARAASPPISKDVKVMADIETNSLIITAQRDEYMVLEEVIQKLDIPRRMVYIEALIMEVSVSKQFEIGVQWGGAGTFSDDTGRLITGFSGTRNTPFSQLQGPGSLTGESPVLPAGFTVGVIKQGVEIGNVLFPNLGAVVKAYKDDNDVDIIAAPQILTTDNKEAEIKVGQNVPYITSANTTAAQQDYTNYEYKDVATTLNILPQVNQSDLVRLEIGVEVIKLRDQNDTSGTPITLKRTANTTVVVHNQETIVIGGIIDQSMSTGEFKVPLLGDIPLLGWLFKTRNNSQEKTNLFIFITPHIVENPAELASLYYQKRDVMEYVKEGSSELVDAKFRYQASPEHAVALSDLGFKRLQEKDYLRARQYFEQALVIDPNYPYALLNLGVISELEGNPAGAAEFYRKIGGLELPAELEEDKQAVRQLREIQEMAAEHLQRLGELPPPQPPPEKPSAQPPLQESGQ
ncbi:MAG TPA: type II secretion system protein GspD [Desulfobacteraceae bacterium]|nr:type II secretion system protein GspD [Desulfobacteraceae bacterium]